MAKISPEAHMLFMRLLFESHLQGDKTLVISNLAEMAGVDERTAIERRNELILLGILEYEELENRYTLLLEQFQGNEGNE